MPSVTAAAWVAVTIAGQWVPVTPVTMLDKVQPVKPFSMAGLDRARSQSQQIPLPERCHQRRGQEVSFSLSCASEQGERLSSTSK